MLPDRTVTLVSHGPNCLDGLTCAVVAARYFAGREFRPLFASNREIDEVLREYRPADPDQQELWITDISWQEKETDDHLNALVKAGVELYWVDHHKSAIDRRLAGGLAVNFSDYVLDDSYAASRLLYNYMLERASARGESKPGLLALKNLVHLADDVDRWILAIEGSRQLALAVRAMKHEDAFRALLALDSNITYGAELQAALARVTHQLADSLALANSTRRVEEIRGRDLSVVAAECTDYAGEIAERWKTNFPNAVFALYDRRNRSVSLRRGPNCPVDLSRLAAVFGGGGHAAAAGCTMKIPASGQSITIAGNIADALSKGLDK